MLPKNERLKSKKDINTIFKHGDSIKGTLLLCKYVENDLGKDRPGFTFAKNLKLKVIQRNRLKRQLVNAYKEVRQQIAESNKTYDLFFILMGQPKEEEKRFEQFKKDITNILTKIRCLKDS